MEDRRQMGLDLKTFSDGILNNITLSVTENCNLACKYCYMVGKNDFKKMSFETAKKAVDFVLNNRDTFYENGVVWDFIGGEPLLEIDLIDAISDYIKQKMFVMEHPWFYNYMFSMATNGLLYSDPKVQNYIRKNKTHMSIGISIDGNKVKHDLQRVYPDGSGSYDDVMKNIPLWLEQFTNSYTKATFSHGDMPYLKDSVISLWGIGIKEVAASIVFEDVWDENDPIIFEQQLKELADYVIENELWKQHNVRFFSERMGLPLAEEQKKDAFCGAGKMLTVDCDGNFYPCIRFTHFSLAKKKGLCIGNVDIGIEFDKLRPFKLLSLERMSKKECLDCSVASECATCAGHNYDNSECGTIFDRAIYNCEMHKANARATEYFWTRFKEVTNQIPQREKTKTKANKDKYLKIIVDDSEKSHCRYTIPNDFKKNGKMSEQDFRKALEFARVHQLTPVIIGQASYISNYNEDFVMILENNINNYDNTIIVNNNEVSIERSENCILRINKDNIGKINSFVEKILQQNSNASVRINLITCELEDWSNQDIEGYKNALEELVNFTYKTLKNEISIEVNILTDLFELKKMCNCDSGVNQFVLAPDGNFYTCPGFYYNNIDECIGNIETGIDNKNGEQYELKSSLVCSTCDAYHCSRCMFLNKKLTNEFRVPSKNQCIISHIERNSSRLLQNLLEGDGMSFENRISEIDYLDPIELIDNQTYIKC